MSDAKPETFGNKNLEKRKKLSAESFYAKSNARNE